MRKRRPIVLRWVSVECDAFVVIHSQDFLTWHRQVIYRVSLKHELTLHACHQFQFEIPLRLTVYSKGVIIDAPS